MTTSEFHITSDMVRHRTYTLQAQMYLPGGPTSVAVKVNDGVEVFAAFAIDIPLWTSIGGDRTDTVAYMLKKATGLSHASSELINIICRLVDQVLTEWRAGRVMDFVDYAAMERKLYVRMLNDLPPKEREEMKMDNFLAMYGRGSGPLTPNKS